VAYLGEVLTDPLTKKPSLITTIKEFFSNIPRKATKMACSHFQPRLEKFVAAKARRFHLINVKSRYK
jgi:hypothetical protein